MLVAGAGLTAFYTFRVIFLTFFTPPRMSPEVAHHVHESPPSMTIPLIALAALTVLAGGLGVPGAHGTAFARFLEPVLPLHEGEHGLASILTLAAVSVAAGVIGLAAAWAMYLRRPVRAEEIGVAHGALHRLVLNKYYVDEIYDALFVRPLFAVCGWCARVFDLGVIDGAVNGVGRAVVAWARGLRRLQTGFVMNYALTMLLGAVAIAAFLLTR